LPPANATDGHQALNYLSRVGARPFLLPPCFHGAPGVEAARRHRGQNSRANNELAGAPGRIQTSDPHVPNEVSLAQANCDCCYPKRYPRPKIRRILVSESRPKYLIILMERVKGIEPSSSAWKEGPPKRTPLAALVVVAFDDGYGGEGAFGSLATAWLCALRCSFLRGSRSGGIGGFEVPRGMRKLGCFGCGMRVRALPCPDGRPGNVTGGRGRIRHARAGSAVWDFGRSPAPMGDCWHKGELRMRVRTVSSTTPLGAGIFLYVLHARAACAASLDRV
jgi:hypothetical protein